MATPSPTPTAKPTPTPKPVNHLTCKGDKDCADGKTCVKYYGIAGPGGPQFSSCERVCDSNLDCPVGTCTTIPDGPGRVCR